MKVLRTGMNDRQVQSKKASVLLNTKRQLKESITVLNINMYAGFCS